MQGYSESVAHNLYMNFFFWYNITVCHSKTKQLCLAIAAILLTGGILALLAWWVLRIM